MKKYKVLLTEITISEIEVQAENEHEAEQLLKESHGYAGKLIKAFGAIEMTAEIILNDKSKNIKLI